MNNEYALFIPNTDMENSLIFLAVLLALFTAILIAIKALASLLIRNTMRMSKTKSKTNKDTIADESGYTDACNMLYLEAKEKFRVNMQSKKMNKTEILYLKKMFEESLGGFSKIYSSRNYKNEAHKIYAMMKCKHISYTSWQDIVKYLDSFA